MPMSDREQRILEELEDEFRPALASLVPSPWWGAGTPRSLAAASCGAVVGLLLLAAGVALDTGIGAALSVLAYVLVVAGVWSIVAGVSGRRATRPAVRVD